MFEVGIEAWSGWLSCSNVGWLNWLRFNLMECMERCRRQLLCCLVTTNNQARTDANKENPTV